MAQIFPIASNTISRLSILLALLAAGGGVGLIMAVERSPYTTYESVVFEQPVPFSHDHHTAGLGIDCRYCHFTVERSSFAGIPPSEVCMNCHKVIWKDSPMLEPVRASYRDNEPIRWNRVHDLPDYVYFDHSIHVNRGVSCISCHGEVNKMPLLKRGASLQMRWCLDCHRDPGPNIRPPEEVVNLDWEPPEDDPEFEARMAKLVEKIDGPERLASCSTCHR